MSNSPVNVAIIANKKITKAEVLSASAKPVKITAVEQGKYILAEGENGVAPENITVKRVGKSLHVILEGSDVNHPDLIIEEFFDKPGILIGKSEDGSIHPFVSTDGESEHDADQLQDGEIASLALGEENEQDLNGLTLAEGFDWSPALLALAGIAALAAAAGLGYLVGKHYSDNDNKSTSSGSDGGNKGGEGGGDGKPVPKPSISSVIDDVGSKTGPIANGGRTDDAKPTFNGKGTPGNTIEIWDGKTKIGEVKVNDKGEWSFTPGTALGAGEHSLISIEKDQDNNTSEPSEEWRFIIDLTAPAAGSIDSATNNNISPEKSVGNGGVTNDSTPKFSGKAEANSTIEIWDNGVLIGTAITDKDGNWSFISPELQEGEHKVSVVVVDEVGNKSLPTPPYIINIDITPPDNSGIETIKDDADNLIGVGGSTSDRTPTLVGKGENGEIIMIIDNGKIIGSTIVENGEWTFTPGDLSDGRHEFETVVVDSAGNESDKSNPVVIDIIGFGVLPPPNPNIPPSGSVDDVFKDNIGNKETSVPRDGHVNDPTLHIVGNGVPGNTVILYITGDNHVYSFTAKIGDDGKWSIYTPELADDFYSVQAAFYNGTETTARSAEYKFEVDTTPPPKPVIPVPQSVDNLDILDDIDVNSILSDAENELFMTSILDVNTGYKLNVLDVDNINISSSNGVESTIEITTITDEIRSLNINDY